ncbi:MAG TPA: terminase gpA endonuclease subunit [Armatimonadota bacterium]
MRKKREQNNTPLARTQALARKLWGFFAPRPLLPGDEWADTFRMLSKGESPEAGKWHTSRVRFIRTPMRAFTDTPGQLLWVRSQDFPELAKLHGCWNPLAVVTWVENGGIDITELFPEPYRVPQDETQISATDLTAIPWTKRNELLVLMGSRQWGKTNFLLNCIGMRMHQRPCGILVTQPTDQLVQRFSKKKLAPMLRDTPVLQGLVNERKEDGKTSNTIAAKEFPGGALGIASAGSPAGLRMDSVEFYAADEIDGYEPSAGVEGDAFDLACEMTQAFYHTRKLVVTSTPLLTLSSRIEPMYLAGTQEEWALSCPHCGAFQVVRFDDRLNHTDLTYACEHCGALSGEWDWKNRPGIHLSGNPEGEHRSFHLQAMYSPFKPWAEIVKQFHAAIAAKNQGNIEPYKVFVNCVEGRTFQEKGTSLDETKFLRNRHYYNCDVPNGVLLLTAQADVQDDRVEVEVRGWGRGLETWGIQRIVINGTMDKTETTSALDALLNKFWTRADGVQLPIVRMVIDSGGHYTQEVYAYARSKDPLVCAIKGSKDPTDPIAEKASHVGRHKTKLFMIGVKQAKDQIFNRLQVEHEGPGFCHWPVESLMQDGITPRGYTEDYYTQLTAEHRVTRYIGGRPYEIWVKKREGLANEGWDLLVYGLAAIVIYGVHMIDVEAKKDESGRQAVKPPVARGRRTYSSGVV